MPLSNILKSVAGTCSFCNQKAGILSREHPECRRTFQTGWEEMITVAAEAARTHTFQEKPLRLTLAEIAQRSYRDGATVNQALEEGWKRGVAQAMTDGIISRDEEERLRAFRDHLALEDNAAGQDAIWDMERASGERLILEARLAAIR